MNEITQLPQDEPQKLKEEKPFIKDMQSIGKLIARNGELPSGAEKSGTLMKILHRPTVEGVSITGELMLGKKHESGAILTGQPPTVTNIEADEDGAIKGMNIDLGFGQYVNIYRQEEREKTPDDLRIAIDEWSLRVGNDPKTGEGYFLLKVNPDKIAWADQILSMGGENKGESGIELSGSTDDISDELQALIKTLTDEALAVLGE
jgi:hypothetical protein